MPDLVGAQFPFGSGAVDSWLAISRRPEHNYAGNNVVTVWKYCVGSQTVNMRSGNRSTVDSDDDLEPVQMKDTETRKVIAMMLAILEQMSRKFVYSRRMKDLRNTKQLFGKAQPLIRNSVCIASSRLSA